MIAVSILVPVYNVEKFLSRCLDSLIHQTFNDVEIICVNDGSTDNGPKLLEQYQKLDKRIKIIHQQNQGLSVARMVGMKDAKGKYILFVDADDYVSTTAVERLYYKAEQTNADMVLFNYGNIIKNGQFHVMAAGIDKKFENEVFNAKSADSEVFMFTPIFTWAKLYRRNLIKNLTFDVGKICQDIGFYAKTFTTAKRIAYLNEPLYNYYNTRDDSTINKNNNPKIFDVLFEYQQAIETFKKAGLYNKYAHTLQRMIVADTLKKLNFVTYALKEEFYDAIKKVDFEIDIQALKKYNGYMGEQQNFVIFELLQQTKKYDEFCNKIRGLYGK